MRHRPRRDGARGGILLKLVVWVFVLVFLAVLWMVREPLLQFCGELWVVDEEPIAADAIVLLGDDNYAAQRAARAAELYHEHTAPLLVASGRYLRPYLSVPDLMLRDLTDRGVPAAAVLRFAGFPNNTREEAVLLRKLAQERRWQRVVVVTSNYHTRRTRYIFRRVMRGVAEVRVIAARDAAYNPRTWWQTRSGVKSLASEIISLGVAAWETRSTESALRLRPELAEAPAPRSSAPPGNVPVPMPTR